MAIKFNLNGALQNGGNLQDAMEYVRKRKAEGVDIYVDENDFQKAKGGSLQNTLPKPEQPKSALDIASQVSEETILKPLAKVAGVAGKTLDIATKPLQWGVGYATEKLGGGVGLGIGMLGETVKQLYRVAKGSSFDGRAILESGLLTAEDTTKFGKQIGQGGAMVAPLGALGVVPNALITADFVAKGTQEMSEGIKNQNEEQIMNGALTTLMSVISLKGMAKGIESKSLFIDKSVTKYIKEKTQDIAGSWSDKLAQNLNRLKKSDQTKFYQQQGESVGEWLNKRNLADKPNVTVENLADYFTKNKDAVDSAMEQLGGQYTKINSPDTFKLMLEDAQRFAETTRDPQAKTISNLVNKFETNGLSMAEINTVKRFFESKNKFSYGKDVTAAEKTAWATNIDNATREWQFQQAEELGLKNLAELNKETQASKFILDKLGAEEAGKLGNNSMTLTDWIVAAGDWRSVIFKKAALGKTAQGITSKSLDVYSGRPKVEVKPELNIPQRGLLEAPKQSIVNEGRPIIALPKNSLEYTGKEIATKPKRILPKANEVVAPLSKAHKK